MDAKQAEVAKIAQPNPANAASPSAAAARRRVPMNIPRRKLEVDPLPGFRLYWHKESDVDRAFQAGYEFVDKKEVHLNSRQIGAPRGLGGNTDLGSNVSIVGTAETGERLVLMKIRIEHYLEDKKELFQHNARALASIFTGEKIVFPDGSSGPPDSRTYVKSPLKPLFLREPKTQLQVGGALVR